MQRNTLPPGDTVGTVVSDLQVLGSREDYCVIIDPMIAYPQGVYIPLRLLFRHDRVDPFATGGEVSKARRASVLELAVFTDDHGTHKWVGGPHGFGDPDPTGSYLAAIRTHGRGSQWEQKYWLNSIPASSSLHIAVTWPLRSIAVSGDIVLRDVERAMASVPLW